MSRSKPSKKSKTHKKSTKKPTKKHKVKIPPRIGTRKLPLSLSVEEKDGLKRMFKFNKEVCYWDRLTQKWKVDVDYMHQNNMKLKLLVHWLTLKQLKPDKFPGGPKMFKRLGGEEAREIRVAIEDQQRYEKEQAKKATKKKSRSNHHDTESSSSEDGSSSASSSTALDDEDDTSGSESSEDDEENEETDESETLGSSDSSSSEEEEEEVDEEPLHKKRKLINTKAILKDKRSPKKHKVDDKPISITDHQMCDTRGCTDIATIRCPYDGMLLCSKHTHRCSTCSAISCKKQKVHKVHTNLEVSFPSSLLEEMNQIPVSDTAPVVIDDDNVDH